MKVNQLKRKKVSSKGIEISTSKVIPGRHFADSMALDILVGRTVQGSQARILEHVFSL